MSQDPADEVGLILSIIQPAEYSDSTGFKTTPLTQWGAEAEGTHRPGSRVRMVPIERINDPLSIMADPAGFLRLLLFELRPVQVVQPPNQVLMLYMFEKRWRVIWTDGRELPSDPDPRW